MRCFLAFSLFLCGVVNGQDFTVTGVVTDSSGTVLAGASVIVTTQADSSLVGFSTSREDGRFTVARLQPDSYVLQVSFVGFETLIRDFQILDQDVDAGIISLSAQTRMLEEFVVRAERLPFVVRGDTIEYHAQAFLLQPQDMLEDLLRRLPGIDVGRDGAITAQGKAVENLLVEGKEFFGDDPMIATKNFPADAVDHVQVFDKSSDLAELTGIPDGQEEKTINIGLTEKAKQGFFGQTTVGLGGERMDLGRYFGRGTLFRFTPRTQFALIGSGENINQPGFSGQQLKGFSEVGSSRDIRSDGYTQSLGFGVNMNQEFSTHTTINASYLLENKQNRKEDVVVRQQLFGDTQTAFGYESNNRKINDLSHQIGLNAEVNLGEGHDLIFRGNFAKSAPATKNIGIERLRIHSGALQNSAKTLSDNSSENLRGKMHLTWRKRISESGLSLVLETTASMRDSDVNSDLHTDLIPYMPYEMTFQEEHHQLQESRNNSFRHSQRVQLIKPLSSGRLLTVYAQRHFRTQDNERLFFDLAGKQRTLIKNLGDGLTENYTILSPGVNFGWYAEDHSWFVSGNLEIQHSRRKGATILKPDQTILKTYSHVLTHVLAKKNLGRDGILNFFYRASTREPTTRQLQPFVDNSIALRTYQGNHLLTPEYHHDLDLGYRLYQSYSGLNLSVDTGISYVHNSIVHARNIDQNLHQNVREVNSRGAWSGDAGIRFGKLVRSIGIGYSLRAATGFERKIELVNGMENTGDLRRNSLGIDLEYYRGDLLEVSTDGRVYWNEIKYSLNSKLNRNYMTGRITSRLRGYVHNSWLIDLNFHYRIFDRDLFTGSQNTILLDVSFSRLFLGGRGNLRFEINDLLNQSRGITLTSEATYIQEIRTESLGRYLMLKFVYKPKIM